jgi:hypothetical protein
MESLSQDKENDVGFIIPAKLHLMLQTSVAISMESLSQDKENGDGFIVLRLTAVTLFMLMEFNIDVIID